MAIKKVKLGERQNCLRCGHNWLPRKDLITICPKCKSPYWDTPRKWDCSPKEQEQENETISEEQTVRKEESAYVDPSEDKEAIYD